MKLHLRIILPVAFLFTAGIIISLKTGGSDDTESVRAPTVFSVPLRDDGTVTNAPCFFVGSFQVGGEYLQEPSGWHVPADGPHGGGSLYIAIDRAILPTNALVMAVSYWRAEGSSVQVDLLDDDLDDVVSDVRGDTVAAEDGNMKMTVQLPMTVNNASVFRLHAQGELVVSDILLKFGVTSENRTVSASSGVATTLVVLRGRGDEVGIDAGPSMAGEAVHPSLFSELRRTGDAAVTPAQGETGVTSVAVSQSGAVTRQGVATNRPPEFRSTDCRVIWVAQQDGDDANDGGSPVVVDRGGNQRTGPTRTIGAGLAISRAKYAEARQTMIVKDGVYGESLNVVGRDISVVIQGHVNLCGLRTAPVGHATIPSSSATNAVVGRRM